MVQGYGRAISGAVNWPYLGPGRAGDVTYQYPDPGQCHNPGVVDCPYPILWLALVRARTLLCSVLHQGGVTESVDKYGRWCGYRIPLLFRTCARVRDGRRIGFVVQLSALKWEGHGKGYVRLG